MIRVALRGLLGRKLRASLTALAIILGVAMMSGTYVLTDTIDKAFATIFDESYAGTDVVVSGKGADISFQGLEAEAPPVDESLVEEVRALPNVEAASGSVAGRDQHQDHRLRRQGHQHPGRAESRLRHRDRPRGRPLQPAQPRRGHLGRRGRRGRDRRRYRRAGGLRGRRHDPDLDAPAEAGLRGHRHRQVRRCRTPSGPQPSRSSTSRRPSGCSTGKARWTPSLSPASREPLPSS